MEVPALCNRLLMGVSVLLVSQVHHIYFAQKTDTAFPRVVPDRLQFYEYDNFSILCVETDAFAKWTVRRKLIEMNTTNSVNWSTSEPWVSVEIAFKKDSGEYWCENEEGDRSNSLNITVTAGFVILESPTRPVIEGYEVILHCRNKKTQSQHIADFYKDGSFLGTQYNNSLMIPNVSKSDEGRYKCSISGAGESPESWLTVVKGSEDDPPDIHSPDRFPLLLILVITFVVPLLLLLLVLALYLCTKHRESGVENEHMIYATVENPRRIEEPNVSRAATGSPLSDESVIYSLVTF
ncbi:low affinity immunoglobulin gamma Fc region receptor III-A-like [Channa argus]|uniref:low affinity immunoglobulin gamma Fc region receptor III-A-like n=1 Tax=Channa argus TaxID=215402 RepID=UPI0035211066